MENNRDEAPTSEAGGGGGGGQPRNPISNGNPNPNPNSNPNPNPNSPRTTSGSKGKSCKGCTYYTSVHKAKAKNPTCIGFSKTLQQVPPHVVGNTEMKASKEGRSITNFKYTCIGYSVYLDNKDSSADSQDETAKLPFCAGLEVVFDSPASDVGHVPAHARKTEEREHATPQPRRNKPPNVTTEQFFDRFQKNASLVAAGCVKNLNRVGSYVKETIGDFLYRRPK